MQNQDLNQQPPLRNAGVEQVQRPNQTLRSIQAAHPLGPRQRSEDSWIEVSSQPSSSSLSSAADEFGTTGLRVRHDSNARRRQKSHGAHQPRMEGLYQASGGTSSQEEYDESESESDRAMTSSNEALRPSPLSQHQEVRRSTRAVFSTTSSDLSEREGDDEEDDDENSTAVNYPRASGVSRFTPQPNAFSHPPTTQTARSEAADAYFSQSRPSARPINQRSAFSSPQHNPYNVVSPSYQADHDAALRASLSTLLSAAKAVRGRGQPSVNTVNTGARVDPSSYRLVSESVAMGGEPSQIEQASPASSPNRNSNVDKYKRKATPPSTTRSSSKDRRVVKKARKMGPMMDEISPTLLTWVVSAGVVVLVSAISFSAGYIVGREAGHAEAVGQLGTAGADAGRCGREAARTGLGLRRLRWTSAPVRV